ncbi:NAD-dependent epimerase/dehydratase family protein [Streptosporangium sp. NBC_01755]|uniref:NAD-dependent epimerase/dehydratase family protein n=1 Tax=unclassified Streptosporangium TaxID=2632669 RepID=UPI002DDAE630|nr:MULTISPECIES: NAD-dependent epimerase/dehydratase family protein [unclassified Streptosporangium]WSA27481.1 NAD-dependent epimerase/dehydratase family protein [Streptosporangium sp. NBC_01810]WSD01048.1 NAD-dependent epimerase/dehydratase family protein [Streptosporangium sp. NBC_01755]
MKLLVLGGTHHVGRAIVETALERGDEVSTLNRGLSRDPAPGVRALIADHTDVDTVRQALGDAEWDAVIDTWAWLQAEGDPAPRADAPSPDTWLDTAAEQRLLDQLSR